MSRTKKGLNIKNGRSIITERAYGYVENVTRIFCITKPIQSVYENSYESIRRKGDKMANNLSGITNEKRCEYCGSDMTYLAVTKNGTPYPKWNSNPFKENTLICGKCYRNLLYHKALPPSHVRRGICKERIAKRVCHQCGCKTTTQKSKTTSSIYHIWHKHPIMVGKWLCGKCYASYINEPKKRFKTKEECYKYISKLFSGTGNPMYGNHTLNLGRVYTEERNRRVAEAVKKWAETHQEHYRKIGVLGALKARKLGLFVWPTYWS